MKKNLLVKPAEQKKALKERLDTLRNKLPTNWIILFIHDNKEYAGQQTFLSNLMLGRSLHQPTINKIENWVKKNN